MPMPTELPLIEWKDVFESGRNFEDWLAAGETPQNLEAIRLMLAEQTFEPEIEKAVGAVNRKVHVVAIAEDWCPDVVRHVPVVQKMSELNPNIRMSFITRAQWLDVLMRFLTVGGEAIPKFIFLSADFIECGNWGPMPQGCRDHIARGKAYGDNSKARQRVFQDYAADPERKIPAREILDLVQIASAEAPE